MLRTMATASRIAGTCRVIQKTALQALSIVLLASLMAAALAAWMNPGQAMAVECTGFLAMTPGGSPEDVSPKPHDLVEGSSLALIYFSDDVLMASDDNEARSEAENAISNSNREKIHLLCNGAEVRGCLFEGEAGKESLVHVANLEWLWPLATYTVQIDAGITSLDGASSTSESYSFEFVTSDLCANGLSLSQNIALAGACVVLVTGILVTAIRIKRGRR